MHIRITLTTILITLFVISSVYAEVFRFEEHDTVIGSIKKHTTKNDESLIEIARKYDLGYNEIADSNPELDPFIPGEGVTVIIPTSWILPGVTSHKGVVINLSEMRLYYFFKKHKA